MSHPDITWLDDYLRPLEGATITSAKGFDEEGEAWPRLRVKMPDGTHRELEIGRDEEGNGPGFIFGLDYPR
jgi:hypothetical protein